MHIKAKPPIFVPEQYRAEIEKLSKAVLMDLVWDFATTHSAGPVYVPLEANVMKALRERAEVILIHRKQAQ